MNPRIAQRLRTSLSWAAFLVVVSLSASLILFELERGLNVGLTNISDLLWWWVLTISGTGSNTEPITDLGRLVTSFVIFSGLVLLGLFIAEFSAILKMIYSRRVEGNIEIRYSGHIVIFGYTSLTAGVVRLLRRHLGRGVKIVLIANDTDTNPFPRDVDFIQGDPLDVQTLREGNVQNAAAVIILANDRFGDPDSHSVVIAAETNQLRSDVVTVVEIMDLGKRELFKRVNINGFLYRHELLIDILDPERDPKLLRIITKDAADLND